MNALSLLMVQTTKQLHTALSKANGRFQILINTQAGKNGRCLKFARNAMLDNFVFQPFIKY